MCWWPIARRGIYSWITGWGSAARRPGNWRVYSANASSDTDGASVMNPTTTVYSTSYPVTTGESGNTWFYSSASGAGGTITITALGQTIVYGGAPHTTAT